MSTPYTGFNPFTPNATPPGYGRWLTGNAIDDGDIRDAAHLNMLPVSAVDKIQWLAWRTIDIVNGGTYTFPSTITLANAFNWTGSHEFRSGIAVNTAGNFVSNRPAFFNSTVQFNGTVEYTDPVVFQDDVTFNDPASFNGPMAVNGQLTMGAPQPAPTANPGGDNKLFSTNTPKSWGAVTLMAGGGGAFGSAVIDDGYNIATFTVDVDDVVVTFAQPINMTYAVMANFVGHASFRVVAWQRTTAGFRMSFLEADGTQITNGNLLGDVSACFVIMGRQ